MRAIRYGVIVFLFYIWVLMRRNPLCVQLDMELDKSINDLIESGRNPLCVQLDMEFRIRNLDVGRLYSRNPLCVQLDMEFPKPYGQ